MGGNLDINFGQGGIAGAYSRHWEKVNAAKGFHDQRDSSPPSGFAVRQEDPTLARAAADAAGRKPNANAFQAPIPSMTYPGVNSMGRAHLEAAIQYAATSTDVVVQGLVNGLVNDAKGYEGIYKALMHLGDGEIKDTLNQIQGHITSINRELSEISSRRRDLGSGFNSGPGGSSPSGTQGRASHNNSSSSGSSAPRAEGGLQLAAITKAGTLVIPNSVEEILELNGDSLKELDKALQEIEKEKKAEIAKELEALKVKTDQLQKQLEELKERKEFLEELEKIGLETAQELEKKHAEELQKLRDLWGDIYVDEKPYFIESSKETLVAAQAAAAKLGGSLEINHETNTVKQFIPEKAGRHEDKGLGVYQSPHYKPVKGPSLPQPGANRLSDEQWDKKFSSGW